MVAGACGAPAAGAAIELRDDQGRTVRLASPARRVASLLPSHTETLVALGVADRIVACDDYSELPSSLAGVPRVGGLEPSIEALLLAEPDLVLAGELGTQAAAVAQAGLPVYGGSAQRWDEVGPTIEAIGRLVGREDEAARLVERLSEEIAAVEREVRARPRPTVYFEIDATPYVAGPDSFVGELVARAGGLNVAPSGDFVVLAPEAILAADPEVIVGLSIGEARARPGWERLDAVREGRVHPLSADERDAIVHPGPRMAEGARVLARILHGEARP